MIYFLAFKDHLWWIIGFINIKFFKEFTILLLWCTLLYFDELSIFWWTFIRPNIYSQCVLGVLYSYLLWLNQILVGTPSVIAILALGMWFSRLVDFASLFLGFFGINFIISLFLTYLNHQFSLTWHWFSAKFGYHCYYVWILRYKPMLWFCNLLLYWRL